MAEMKKALSFVLLVLMMVAKNVSATEKADVSGIVRTDYYGDSGKASISQVRFNVFVPTATDTYYFVRVEPNRYNLDSEDWLKLFFFQYKNITIGRLPSNEGYALPTPNKLFTVMWPRISGGFYANGIQIMKLLDTGYSVVFEISGSPDGTAIRDNLNRSQVSLRLAKGRANLIFHYDDNQNSQAILSGEKSFANFAMLMRGAFYLRRDENKEKSGGYIFTEKSFGKKFGLHFQTDFAERSETINTIGLRFIQKKGFAILDYEMTPHQNRMLGSVVITF